MLLSSQHYLALSEHAPQLATEQKVRLRAAVAIVLRNRGGQTECLLMQRAAHEGDPWSGQMSFPGGKLEPEDANALNASIRETAEEVGLQLSQEMLIGQLDDQLGIDKQGEYGVCVSCYVFNAPQICKIIPNHEVADTVWLPFSLLYNRKAHFSYKVPFKPEVEMPAVMLNEDTNQVLWGLTYRMLKNFCSIASLPVVPEKGGG